MRHILVDKDDLTVSISREPPMDGYCIPVLAERWQVNMPMHGVVYGLLYHFKHAEDKARGVSAKYMLAPPDPWLVAIAAVMWEGLVQGLTWDVIKVAVLGALDTLRSQKLAPPQASASVQSSIRAGFGWTKFSRDGRPLHDFFVGLEREYKKKQRRGRGVRRAKAKRKR